jgi:flavin reductase
MAEQEPETQHPQFREALRSFASGVAVVTIADGNDVHGMTASSFTSVSLEPELCSVSVNKMSTLAEQRSRMHALLSATDDHYGISILTDRQGSIADFYARRPWAVAAGVETIWHDGCPVIGGALAWFVCRKWATYDGGDHTIFVGRALAHGVHRECGLAPLIHHDSRYHQLGVQLAHTDVANTQ